MVQIKITRYKTYLIFYEQFKVIYKKIKYDMSMESEKSSPSDEDSIIAIMFLYLTLESFVAHCLRFYIDVIFYEDDRIRAIWQNEYETAYLKDKIKFFQNVSFPFVFKEEFQVINGFLKEITKYRNAIIHGHESSSFITSDGQFGGSRFYKMIEKIDVPEHYRQFLIATNSFLKLLENIPTTTGQAKPGVNWSVYIKDFRNDIFFENK